MFRAIFSICSNGESCSEFFEVSESEIKKYDFSPPLKLKQFQEDLRQLGRERKICPYFTARNAINRAHIVVYSYHYILDPKIAELVSKDFSRKSVVVFDEAHNIDNVCIESMSVAISQKNADRALQELQNLEGVVGRMKSANSEKLQSEYDKLVEGLKRAERERANDERLANPCIPDDILKEAVPGNIRQANHFLLFLKRFVEYVRHRLRTHQVWYWSASQIIG